MKIFLPRGKQFILGGIVRGSELNKGRDVITHFGGWGRKKEFQQLCQQVVFGDIKPAIDRTFPLEHAADAHRPMEDKYSSGKLFYCLDRKQKGSRL